MHSALLVSYHKQIADSFLDFSSYGPFMLSEGFKSTNSCKHSLKLKKKKTVLFFYQQVKCSHSPVGRTLHATCNLKKNCLTDCSSICAALPACSSLPLAPKVGRDRRDSRPHGDGDDRHGHRDVRAPPAPPQLLLPA